jgi:hypothetical protein
MKKDDNFSDIINDNNFYKDLSKPTGTITAPMTTTMTTTLPETNDENIFVYSGNKKPQTTAEVANALDGVNYVCEHLKREDEEKKVKEQWKYVALVVDRLFLWIFTTACFAGTCSIIFTAPSFYDTKPPIDKIISQRF